MAHVFWKGTLGFGLVEIGVSLRPARAPKELSFTLLDRSDFSPVGNRRYNKKTKREVPWERVVHGYEYQKDRYVVLSDDELKRANAEATQRIEVVRFVDRGDIDPIYYETPYFVVPQARYGKSYSLLRDALLQTGLIGITRLVLRTRQHVAALVVHEGVMMLDLLRTPEELRVPADVELPKNGKGRPSAAELRMAVRLVEEMRGDWKPQEFRDAYRRQVLAMIQKKVRSGKTHEIVEGAPEAERRAPSEVVDLMSALKQSLERRGPATARRTRGRGTRREAPARRRA
jgi:DNA end-binding protein Ku